MIFLFRDRIQFNYDRLIFCQASPISFKNIDSSLEDFKVHQFHQYLPGLALISYLRILPAISSIQDQACLGHPEFKGIQCCLDDLNFGLSPVPFDCQNLLIGACDALLGFPFALQKFNPFFVVICIRLRRNDVPLGKDRFILGHDGHVVVIFQLCTGAIESQTPYRPSPASAS